MRTVYKYPVSVSDIFTLELPQGAEILTVQTQGGGVSLWALVDPDAPTEGVSFRLAGTGHPVREASELQYINTFQLSGGALVFHLFKITEPRP